MPRKRQTFSVSGSSSELRHHIQFSAVKKDCRLEVVLVSEAAGGTLDDLDFAVQPLCRGVRYAVHDCRPDPGPMAFQRQSGFSNRFHLFDLRNAVHRLFCEILEGFFPLNFRSRA